MSGENIEKVRRGFAAANRGDIEGALEEWAPDAIWDWSNSRGFEAGVFRGHDEIRAFWQRFWSAFEEVRMELVDLLEVEDDLLIVENIAYMRGREGIEVQARSAWLVTFRDGEQTSLTLYQTKQEALEAARLRESAMSQENVELARRTFEAFNRTFTEGRPDLYELLDPEVEWVPMSAILDQTRYQGHDGVRQWVEEMKRDWTSFKVRPERHRDIGGDRVLTMGTWRAEGRGGGVLLDFPQATWLTQYRKGKLVMLRTFTDRKQALEAAGLSE
jgi:ketosteroid isomerase-like protein